MSDIVHNQRFIWDSEKNQANIKKHRISFEEAVEVFNDINALEFYDSLHSTENEDRYIILGDIGELILVTLIFTERSNLFKIISARFAEPQEKEVYLGNLKRTFS